MKPGTRVKWRKRDSQTMRGVVISRRGLIRVVRIDGGCATAQYLKSSLMEDSDDSQNKEASS